LDEIDTFSLEIQTLLAALTGKPSRHTLEHTASALGKIGAPAIDPLLASLKDANRRVRNNAAWALGKFKDPRVVEALIAALKNPDSGLRNHAASALGKIKNSEAVESLIEALKDPDPDVRYTVAEALGNTSDTRAVSALLAAFRQRDTSVVVGAHRFFIKKGIRGSEDVLIEALNNTDYQIDMVESFLNCRNSKLEKAARELAGKWPNARITPSLAPEYPVWGSGSRRKDMAPIQPALPRGRSERFPSASVS